jgi:hypothetical protein
MQSAIRYSTRGTAAIRRRCGACKPEDITVIGALGTGTKIDISGFNSFRARPVNNSPTPWSPDSVTARLRVADCGARRLATHPIVEADGLAVSGAEVVVRTAGARLSRTLTAADGRISYLPRWMGVLAKLHAGGDGHGHDRLDRPQSENRCPLRDGRLVAAF